MPSLYCREAGIQVSLMPVPIWRIDPNVLPESGDALGVGVAVSGQRYLLKASIGWHRLQHVSEWICNGLAKCLNLPVPHWEHCVLPDGRDAIGSRIEATVVDRQYIPVSRASADNPEVVSHTYVLDLFVANGDRHQCQWLLTEAGGGVLLRPIDFSRAWFYRWPLPTPPFGPGCHLPPNHDKSFRYYTLAKRHGVVISEEAHDAWGALRHLPKSTWHSIINSVPAGWLSQQELIDLKNWWWSPQWFTRLSWIKSQL